MSKEQFLKNIIDDIFKLDSPQIDESRREQIKNFITSIVNGDLPISHIAINANFSEKEEGVTVLILTNMRLIKINIFSNQEIKSNSYFLNTISAIERNLNKDGRVEFAVTFKNGSLGLRYPQDNQKITDFFQRIEHLENK